MKKIVIAVLAVCSFGISYSQIDVEEKAKAGSFYLGANIGVPLNNASDISSFNFGFDGAYLFELIENLEFGGLVGYTHFIGDGVYYYQGNNQYKYKDVSFIPIAASGRYYFADHTFFGGLDLGIGINAAGDAKSGFYARPKFGYNLGSLALIASFQNISGGSDYKHLNDNNPNNDVVTSKGFNSFNFGVEFKF